MRITISMKRCECFYNENLDIFEIYNGELRNTVTTIKGKYGIELTLDIDNKPIAISIPEPEVVFGFGSEYLKHFSCT